MARTVDPRVTVNPVAVLTRQYQLALSDISRRLLAGTLRADSYLVAQIPHILAALERLDLFAARWARQQIPLAYRHGAAVAQAELVAARISVGAAFSGFDTAAATALVTRTSANLANVQAALVQGLLGGEKPTSAKAVRLMREALTADGKVQATARGLSIRMPRSGRMWDATKYAKMEAKTATFDSLRVARRNRYLQNGVDVVIVTSTGTEHDVCAVWEGERLSLTGATPGLPTPEDARADGLWHPNCEHSYTPAPPSEQPGGDLTQEEEPAFPTLGQRPSTVRAGA